MKYKFNICDCRFLRDGEDSGEEGSDLEGVSEGEEEGEEDVEEEEEELDEDGNVIEKVSHKKQVSFHGYQECYQ